GQKNFRGENPEPGSAISYWLKGNAQDVRVSIRDITGREVRSLEGPKNAGLNRVRWDLRANAPPRGTAAQAEQPAATAPAMPPPGGGQGAGREDRPPAAPQQGRGAQGARGAQPQGGQQAAAGEAGQGGRGRGRGNVAPPLPAGTYLVKLIVDGKEVGTKTVAIEADSLQQ